MTKARGAADSIGKAGRGASFLLPAFSPYYVPYFPLFLRARARPPIPHLTYATKYTHTNIYPRSLSFLSSPLVSVDLLSYPPSPSTPFSFCLSSSFRAAFVLFVAIVHTCTRVCVYVHLVSIVVREVSMSHGSTLPRREGGFIRG